MYNREEIERRITFLNDNISYYNTRIRETIRIRDLMNDYFEKYQLSNSTADWDNQIELLKYDRAADEEQLKKAKKMLKLLDEIDSLAN